MRNTINTLSLLLVNNKTDLTGKKKKLDNTTEMPLTCYILSHVLSDMYVYDGICFSERATRTKLYLSLENCVIALSWPLS